MRRADDNPDTLRKRLQAYHTQTTPLISYYSSQNIVRKIDASTDQHKIFECIKNAFEEMKGRKLYYYFLNQLHANIAATISDFNLNCNI